MLLEERLLVECGAASLADCAEESALFRTVEDEIGERDKVTPFGFDTRICAPIGSIGRRFQSSRKKISMVHPDSQIDREARRERLDAQEGR